MIVLNESQQREPIGGHHFPEGAHVIKGKTFDEVVHGLTDYRITNGKPVGNPKREVLEYYDRNFPYMTQKGEGPYVPDVREDYIRYRSWVFSTWKNPPKKTVTTKEATLRHEICDKCSERKPASWGSSQEAEELARRSFMLRCGLKTCGADGYCSCNRWPIETSVFLDQADQFSAKEPEVERPASC
jgi:hypothetical protein